MQRQRQSHTAHNKQLGRTIRRQVGSPQHTRMSGAFRSISTVYPISFNHRIQVNLKSKLHLQPRDLNNFTLFKVPLFLVEIILSRGEIATDFHNYSPLKEVLSQKLKIINEFEYSFVVRNSAILKVFT